MNPFLTHPGDWNTTCTVPNWVDGGACIFARARPTSSSPGLTNRRSKTNRPFPSLGSLAHNTSDRCPTIVLDWTVILKAATLERKKNVISRKLQKNKKTKPSIGDRHDVNTIITHKSRSSIGYKNCSCTRREGEKKRSAPGVEGEVVNGIVRALATCVTF